jgi:hypothetical protein
VQSTLPDLESRSESRICCAIDFHLTTVFLFAQSFAQIMLAFRRCRASCGNRAMDAAKAENTKEYRTLSVSDNSCSRTENQPPAARFLWTEAEFSLITPKIALRRRDTPNGFCATFGA